MYKWQEEEQEMYQLWDLLLELGIATEGEIGVAVHFGGKNLATLESLLFYFTGYRSLSQYLEYLEEES